MKNVLLFLLLTLAYSSYSQDYRVKIQIEGVTDLASAKSITDPLRYKYETYPTFNVNSGFFEFVAIYDFTQEEIQLIISDHGYTILYYSSMLISEELEKIEEK